jgi:hypothetical protein
MFHQDENKRHTTSPSLAGQEATSSLVERDFVVLQR